MTYNVKKVTITFLTVEPETVTEIIKQFIVDTDANLTVEIEDFVSYVVH